jgi:hypothetical protein
VGISEDGRHIMRSFNVSSPEWYYMNDLPEKATVLEIIPTFGENHVLRALLDTGEYAVFHSPDHAQTFRKVFSSSEEIIDVSVVADGWVMMFLADGTAYESHTTGYSWELVTSDAPLVRSLVHVLAKIDGNYVNVLLGHTRDLIVKSTNRFVDSIIVADLTEFATWDSETYPSIDGGVNAIIATAGSGLVKCDPVGANFVALPTKHISDWATIAAQQPRFRQVRFVQDDPTHHTDWKRSLWMLSVELGSKNTIRSYITTPSLGDGVFRPVADDYLDDTHRLNVVANALAGSAGTDLFLGVSGKRTIKTQKVTQITSSTGAVFEDNEPWRLVNNWVVHGQ